LLDLSWLLIWAPSPLVSTVPTSLQKEEDDEEEEEDAVKE
jgi:hypothetical protein